MKNFMTLILMIVMTACGHLSNAPRMDRKIKIWNGSPEEAGICRMSSAQLQDEAQLQIPVRILKRFHQGTTSMECLSASDPAFKAYACLTFEDIGVLNAYIEKLINSCKKWE
jgi:hypothetical protein